MSVLITTARTSLRSVARVNRYHLHSGFLNFVSKKSPELGKRPAMQPALAFTMPGAYPVSNLSQILNHDSCARGGTLDNPFGENVVTITPKPYLSASQLSQVAFSRFSAFGLKCPPIAEVAVVNLFAMFLTKKLSLRSNRRVVKTQIHADNFTASNVVNFWQANYHIQPELTFAVKQVSTVNRIAGVFSGVATKWTGTTRPPALPVVKAVKLSVLPFLTTLVVADRTKPRTWLTGFSTVFLSSKSAFQSFGSLDPGCANKLARQHHQGFNQIVSGFMKFNAVFLGVLPAVLTDIVKDLGESVQGLM